jgi:glycosyltransferase involved in cell wall biosynthesis
MAEPASSTGPGTSPAPTPGPGGARNPASVLLVTPRWCRDGGIATHVQASAAALAAEGLEVHVLAKQVETAPELRGVSVIESSSLLDREAPAARRLAAARSLSPGIVHLHELDDPALVQELRERAPVVISAHGYPGCTSGLWYFKPGQECHRGHGPGCIGNLAFAGCAHTHDPRPLPGGYRRTTRAVAALRTADLAISYSSSVDRHLAANEIDHRRIVPLFATLEPVEDPGRRDRRRVLFAGRIVAAKGLAVLIEAAREVDAEFVICGEGWQLERMRALAMRRGVAERFEFRGWLAPGQLSRELAEASLVVLPSVWPEPFGLIGIEAHAAGRPVVASATGGTGDWLEDGVSGLLVAPGEPRELAAKLNELLADPGRRRLMGEAGRRNVAERFSRRRHVEAILDAYRAAGLRWKRSRG